MRILFDSNIQYAGEITGTNASLNYLANNIKHQFYDLYFRSYSDNSVIIIPFDYDVSMDCFCFGLHNFATLTVVLKNSVGGTLATIVVNPIYDIGVEYFTQVDAVRSIEITATTAEAELVLGNFDYGLKTQMPNFLADYPIGKTDNSISRTSKGGQVTYENIRRLNKYNFGFIEMLRPEILSIIDDYELSGMRPIFIDITENNRDYFAPVYGQVFLTDPKKTNRRYSNEIVIQEAR